MACDSPDNAISSKTEQLFTDPESIKKSYPYFKKFPFDWQHGLPSLWVTRTELDSLVALLDSKAYCHCYVNVCSSYIPNDYATVAALAELHLQAIRYNVDIQNEILFCCPKTKKEAIQIILNRVEINKLNKKNNNLSISFEGL